MGELERADRNVGEWIAESGAQLRFEGSDVGGGGRGVEHVQF
jgi:hypothetical protein